MKTNETLKSMGKRALIALFAFLFLACMKPARALADETVPTGQTGSETSASEEEGTGQEVTKPESKIKVIREKQKIRMIAGERRTLPSAATGIYTYESGDPSIVAVNGLGQIFGMKAGTTTLAVKGVGAMQIYTVEVRDTVDVIVFAGQSNMAGAGGNYTMAPIPETGTAYEFNIATADEQKVLTMREPFGNGTNRSFVMNGRVMTGNGTICSSFSIAYFKKTNVPVVGVPCAWGGTTSNTWLSSGILEESLQRLAKCKKYLKKHKCKIRHIYVVWYQGESDGVKGYSGDNYIKNMKKIWSKFKKKGCEKIFMIRIAQQIGCPGMMDEIQAAQDKLCKQHKDFIMASTVGCSMHQDPGKWYSDIVHINQGGLNKIGTAAGQVAGKYAKKNSKKKKSTKKKK